MLSFSLPTVRVHTHTINRFLFILKEYFVCMGVLLYVCLCTTCVPLPVEARRGIRYLIAGVGVGRCFVGAEN